MIELNTVMKGRRIYARKCTDGSWIIYQLIDTERMDTYHNRKYIDKVDSRDLARQYVLDLDDEGPDYGEL